MVGGTSSKFTILDFRFTGDDDLFLVVASDGVWDTMSNDLVAKFVLVNTCKIVDKGLNVGK